MNPVLGHISSSLRANKVCLFCFCSKRTKYTFGNIAKVASFFYSSIGFLLSKRLSNIPECKDQERSHDTCVKLTKELGLRVCDTGIGQLKTKLERSCAKTCHFCV